MRETVLLRAVNKPWPFPPHYQLVPQPLAAPDLLDYPDPHIRCIAHGVLLMLADTRPTVLARRSARARASSGLVVGKVLRLQERRAPRPGWMAIRGLIPARRRCAWWVRCGCLQIRA